MWRTIGTRYVSTARAICGDLYRADSELTIASALTITGYASAAAPGARPLYLILTEHHSDHIFGMSVMRSLGCRTIAAKGFNDFISSHGHYKEFIVSAQRDRDAAETIYAGVEIGLADREIEDETTLMVDDLEID